MIPHVPALGATETDVPRAAALAVGANVTHYWEDSGIVGRLYEKTLGIDGVYAWDVWMAYRPGAEWTGTLPPAPDFAMHQIGSRKVMAKFPKLDSGRFAAVVEDYLSESE